MRAHYFFTLHCMLSIIWMQAHYISNVKAYSNAQSASSSRLHKQPSSNSFNNSKVFLPRRVNQSAFRLANSHSIDESDTSIESQLKYSILTPIAWRRKILPATVLLMVLRKSIQSFKVLSTLPLLSPVHCHKNGSYFLLKNFLLPSLASSCCLIQLVVNFFTIGCVGFNSILGPLRPWFISLQLFITISSIEAGEFNLLWFLISWILSFTPEIVAFVDNKKRLVSNDQFLATTNYTNTEPVAIDLIVEDMGCVACINKIESTVRKVFPEKLLRIESRLNIEEKGGHVRIQINDPSDEIVESITDEVISLIQGAGFKCHYALSN